MKVSQIKKIFIVVNLLNGVIREVIIITVFHSFRNTSLYYVLRNLMIYLHFGFIKALVSFIKREFSNYRINMNH